MNELGEHLKKSQKYLKLGDGEIFDGNYIGWEHIVNSFGTKAYRFTLEREDGSRITWDVTNLGAVKQISDLIDKGLHKGSKIKIRREGIEKGKTKYFVTEETPF